MKIELDQDKCIGAGLCVIAAPELFDQRDDDGIAFLLEETALGAAQGAAREAAAVCPAAAITLRED